MFQHWIRNAFSTDSSFRLQKYEIRNFILKIAQKVCRRKIKKCTRFYSPRIRDSDFFLMLGKVNCVFLLQVQKKGTRVRRTEILEVNEARKVLPRLVFLLELFKRMGQARKCFANKAKFRICVCQVLTTERDLRTIFRRNCTHQHILMIFCTR